MATLKVFQVPGTCPAKLPAGTEIEVYITCSCELAGFPRTKYVMDPILNINPGDTVELGENFSFAGAPSGTGYWRKYIAVVNKNKVDVTKIGEEGSEALSAGITFTIAGTSKEQVEFSDTLVKLSGCLVAMIRPRGSVLMEGIGTKGLPATVDTVTMDGGEKAGDPNNAVYRMKTDATPWFINDTTYPIDVTPNP